MSLELHNCSSCTKCSNVVITLILLHHKYSFIVFARACESSPVFYYHSIPHKDVLYIQNPLFCVHFIFAPLLVSANGTCKIDNKKFIRERICYLNHTGRMSYENRHTNYTDPTSFPFIQPMPGDPCLHVSRKPRVRERKHRAAVCVGLEGSAKRKWELHGNCLWWKSFIWATASDLSMAFQEN